MAAFESTYREATTVRHLPLLTCAKLIRSLARLAGADLTKSYVQAVVVEGKSNHDQSQISIEDFLKTIEYGATPFLD